MNKTKSLQTQLRELGYTEEDATWVWAMSAMAAQDADHAAVEAAIRQMAEVDSPDENPLADLIGCCGDPRPRIQEQSGRLFCGNCRRYLDVPRGEDPTEGEDE